jgi:hypothetical protein
LYKKSTQVFCSSTVGGGYWRHGGKIARLGQELLGTEVAGTCPVIVYRYVEVVDGCCPCALFAVNNPAANSKIILANQFVFVFFVFFYFVLLVDVLFLLVDVANYLKVNQKSALIAIISQKCRKNMKNIQITI